jgi:transcriptional regulator with XRE-family HTH domain
MSLNYNMDRNLQNRTLAESIEKLMAQKGLKAADLAHNSGVPRSTIHKIVTGNTARPHAKALKLLSEYFNVPVDRLLQGKIDEYIQRDRINTIPIIEWENIGDWLTGKLNKDDFQTTPTNLDISNKSFALIFNGINATPFQPGSVLIFDPDLEVKDGVYVLVKLSEHPDVLLRQVVCDVSNTKHLKSLNQEFSSNIKKLESNDKVIAILIMAKTLYYHK